MEVLKEKKSFTDDRGTIIVEPIMRVRNPMIQDKDHEAFFLFGNSTIDYCLPQDKYGNMLNPFESKEEQRWVEEELDLDLNYHKHSDNFWATFKVRLGKDSKQLNLKNPKHYLEYLVLRANRLYIAPDAASMGNKATYRYALVSKDYKEKQSASRADLEMDAYMALGKIKDDQQAMVNFLKVYGKRVAPESKRTFLVTEIKKIIDKDIQKFLDLINDRDNYEMRLLIAEAVECEAVVKQGRKYTLPGGDNLCGPGETSVMDTVIKYLQSPGNQDILSMIRARVDNAKD